MKNYEISDVLIKTSGLAEYVAAHHLLSEKTNIPVFDGYLTGKDYHITFPLVGIGANSGKKIIQAFSNSGFNRLVINFSDFDKIEEILSERNNPILYIPNSNETFVVNSYNITIRDNDADVIEISHKSFEKMIEFYQKRMGKIK